MRGRTSSSPPSSPGTKSKLKTLGRRYKVEHLVSYADADKLFDSGMVDAAYIATPNTEHTDWVVRAAERGLHVLCEKPLATSVRDCERMIDACERNNVRLMTAYRLHFERCNLEAAQLVRSKRIGESALLRLAIFHAGEAGKHPHPE